MAEAGQVIEIKDNMVVVKLQRQEACASCKACIAGLEGKEMFIEADNKCDAEIGDWVNISLEQSSFLQAVFIVYTIPLIALLLGMAIGYFVLKNELGTILLGFLFLGVSFLVIKMNEKNFSKGTKYRPIAGEKIVKTE